MYAYHDSTTWALDAGTRGAGVPWWRLALRALIDFASLATWLDTLRMFALRSCLSGRFGDHVRDDRCDDILHVLV